MQASGGKVGCQWYGLPAPLPYPRRYRFQPMRTIFAVVIAFVSGIAVHAMLARLYPPDPLGDRAVAGHWSVVRKANEHLRDRANYAKDVQTGLWKTEVPADFDFSLAAQAAAGELEYVDLVLPMVPRAPETNANWMRFVDARPDTIVYATGNPEYVAYTASGESPLHLQLWLKSDVKSDVQMLISGLEELAKTLR
jgi:hypothetical protein